MKTNHRLITLVPVAALLLASCGYQARVGALRNESQSVELGDARSVRVEINMGTGNLALTGGAAKLLEADFTYNVDRLKPQVEYKNDTLVVRQPDASGFPSLRNITGFRVDWGLRLSDKVPMDLRVTMGAGSGDLHLAGLSLTGLDVKLGAGAFTLDLSGAWARNLDVTIDAGATNINVLLPRDVGARVKVESGPHTIDATGLTRDGDAYTNDAYGASAVTMRVDVKAGIGNINLEVEK